MINSAMMLYIVLSDSSDETMQEDPSIGLYNITNTVTGGEVPALVYADDAISAPISSAWYGKLKYALGFLAQDSIGDIGEGGNYRLGGGILENRQASFSLNNTTQLKDRLDAMGVSLVGKQVYVVDFSWYQRLDLQILTQSNELVCPLFFGQIDSMAWDETRIRFTAVPNAEVSRRSNIMINGLPVTFGNVNEAFCKRADNGLDIPTYLSHYCFTGDPAHKDIIDFEVVGEIKQSSRSVTNIKRYHWFIVRLAGDRDGWLDGGAIPALTRRLAEYLYINGTEQEFFCVGEDGRGIGGFAVPLRRPYVGAGLPLMPWADTFAGTPEVFFDNTLWTTASNEMVVLLDRPLLADNIPNIVRFVRADVLFMADGWPNTVTDVTPFPANLATYKDGRRWPLSLYGEWVDYVRYMFGLTYDDFNPTYMPERYPRRLAHLPKEINDSDASEGLTYKVIPMRTVELLTEGNLSRWELSNRRDNEFGGAESRGFGVYGRSDNFSVTHNAPIFGDNPPRWYIGGSFANELSSYLQFDFSGTGGKYYYALKFVLPDIPQGVLAEKYYIALKLDVTLRGSSYDELVTLRIRVRDRQDVAPVRAGSYLNLGTVFPNGSKQYSYVNNYQDETITLENSTYPSRTATYDDLFLRETLLDDAAYNNDGFAWMGYRLFEVTGINFANGRQKECLLLFGELDNINYPTTTGQIGGSVLLYGAGLLLEGVVDQTSGIHAATSGRLIDDSWDERRLPNSLIASPVDAIEHIRRLSNWSEARLVAATGDAPNVWGKAYPPSDYTALVDTAAFDAYTLDIYKQQRVSGQVVDESEANTDTIAASICNEFFLVNKKTLPAATSGWLGAITPPYESIVQLDTPPIGGVPIISLNQINLFGEVTEPDVGTVFCEPIIKYAYVHGLNQYTKTLEVRGVITERVWRKELTPGFTDSDGQAMWNKCKALFNKYRTSVEMPSNLQEQRWIGDYYTALWKLNHLLDWTQKSRIDITVPWEVGRAWGVGTFIRLSLPHIRDGAALPCVIEGVGKRKYANSVKCNLIILDWGTPTITPIITLFRYYPAPVFDGYETITLQWETENTDTVEIVGFATGLEPNYELTIPINQIDGFGDGYEFTIIARNSSGNATKTLTISFGVPMTLLGSINTSPTTVYSTTGSGAVTVRWVILNAMAVTLNGAEVALSGEETFIIAETTTFTIWGYSNWDGSQYTSGGSISATVVFVPQPLPNWVMSNVIGETEKYITAGILPVLSGNIGARRPPPIIPVPPAGVTAETGTITAVIYADGNGVLLTGSIGARRPPPIIPVPPAGVTVEDGVFTTDGICGDVNGALLVGSIGDRRAGHQITNVISEAGFISAFIDPVLTGSIGPRYS